MPSGEGVIELDDAGPSDLVAVTNRGSDMGVGTMTRHAALMLGYGTIMMGICGLACMGPLLRVSRVEPTDVLRDDG